MEEHAAAGRHHGCNAGAEKEHEPHAEVVCQIA